MKIVWFAGQCLFLFFAIASALSQKTEFVNQYLILSFEMAILYKLESKL